ncbi:MAG: cytochrome c-type biogenesis protein [Caulobacteraceae bacterium]
MRPAARIAAALAGLALIAGASDPAERLSDPGQEARARALFKDVRCLVCQNESIDDSEAPLAKDLRVLIREQIRQGRTNAQILAYLKARYGEFVLLTPAFSLPNAVLWGGPFAVVGVGAVFLFLRRRREAAPETELSQEDEAALKDLARPPEA